MIRWYLKMTGFAYYHWIGLRMGYISLKPIQWYETWRISVPDFRCHGPVLKQHVTTPWPSGCAAIWDGVNAMDWSGKGKGKTDTGHRAALGGFPMDRMGMSFGISWRKCRKCQWWSAWWFRPQPFVFTSMDVVVCSFAALSCGWCAKSGRRPCHGSEQAGNIPNFPVSVSILTFWHYVWHSLWHVLGPRCGQHPELAKKTVCDQPWPIEI